MSDQDPITRLNAALEGRYRVERQLGEGGMATVYLATDLRHERNVALKVLKPELAAVVGAERFLAEIKTTANLQHPHILPLFDSGEADGFLFYVMPFVEGESLRDRLDRERQLPVEEAVRIATNVAEALDHAHRHGVIHRDIKPANILVRDGKPVVSDFGIALAVGMAGGGRLTETGLSLGTPHYMSPEQATGDLGVGPAADVYALACVLYETLVGEPPYTGGTAQAILGKIVTGDADPVTKHRKAVPANVEAAIRRALEKVPADRFPSAQAFAEALADPSFRHGDALVGAAAPGGGPWRAVAIGAIALSLVLGATMVWAPMGAGPTGEGILRFTIDIPDSLPLDLGGSGRELAISPDGRTLVYQTREGPEASLGLRLRPLDQLGSVPLGGTDGAYDFVFSPDGAWIAFGVSPGQRVVRKIPALGGAPVTLVSLEEPGLVYGMSWSDDGSIILGDGRGGLLRVPENGGPAEEISTPEEGTSHRWPSVIPGRGAVLFTIGASSNGLGDGQLAVMDLDDGTWRRLGVPGTNPRYLAGQLLYATDDGTLRGVPFDVDRLEVKGSPVPLVEDLYVKNTGSADFDVSNRGELVYARGVALPSGVRASTLVWVDRDGREEPLGAPSMAYDVPRLSPDGTRAVLNVNDGSAWTVRVWDFGASTLTRLTLGDGDQDWPVWSADGTRIAYQQNSRGVWWKAANNTGQPELLVDSIVAEPQFFTPDGASLVIEVPNEADGRRPDLFMTSLTGGAPVPSLSGSYAERDASLSPDGRWMAYLSDESGQIEVYVRPFPDVDRNQVQVSNAGTSSAPVWSKQGGELFYASAGAVGSRSLMSVTFDADAPSGRFTVVSRQTVMEWPYDPDFDVSADGRFLALKPEGGSPGSPDVEIVVVHNWLRDVRERMGGS